MLAHIDRIASCSWWRFVGCTFRPWSSCSTTSQRCSIGLRLVTVGAILVQCGELISSQV